MHYDLPRRCCGCPPDPWIEAPAVVQGQVVGEAANRQFVAGVGIGVRIGGNLFLEERIVSWTAISRCAKGMVSGR